MVWRPTLKGMARLVLAAILFTQAALLFAACETASRAPVLVIALAERGIDGENCHDEGINLNLCLAHCLGDDQSLDKPLVKLPVFPSAPIFSVPLTLVAFHDMGALRSRAVPPVAGPPPRILFRSFLI